MQRCAARIARRSAPGAFWAPDGRCPAGGLRMPAGRPGMRRRPLSGDNAVTNTAENRPDRLTVFGSFTSSSTYKPVLYLSLARLPFSFRTVNLKYGVQKNPDYLAVNRYGQVPGLRHLGLTIVQSNVILDYL